MQDHPDKDYPKYTQVEPLRGWRELKKPKLSQKPSSIADNGRQSVPETPYEWWLKPSGNVVALPMFSTRNLKEAIDPYRYHDFVVRSNMRKGWMPWKWDAARKLTPQLVPGDVTNEDEWLVYREKEQAKRKAAHEKDAEKYRRAWATQDEAQALKSQNAMREALTRFTDAMADQVSEKASKPRKKRTKKAE